MFLTRILVLHLDKCTIFAKVQLVVSVRAHLGGPKLPQVIIIMVPDITNGKAKISRAQESHFWCPCFPLFDSSYSIQLRLSNCFNLQLMSSQQIENECKIYYLIYLKQLLKRASVKYIVQSLFLMRTHPCSVLVLLREKSELVFY